MVTICEQASTFVIKPLHEESNIYTVMLTKPSGHDFNMKFAICLTLALTWVKALI